MICALVSLAVGFGATNAVVDGARDLTSVLQKQTELGANVYVVASPIGQNFSAAECEALRNVAGVKSAGARIGTYTATSSQAPSDPITIWEVTPGFVRIAFPDLSEESVPGGLYFGTAIAADVGVAPGSTLDIDREGGRFVVVSGESALSTERLNGSSRVALAPLISDAPASACFVEADVAYRDAVGKLLITWFGPASEWTVASLLPADRFEISVQDSLRNGSMMWIWAVLGGFAVLTASILSWSRRQEFALYGLLGLRAGHVLGLLTLEWIATMFAPAVCGGLLATIYLGPVEVDPLFGSATVVLIAAFYLVLCTAPALGFVLLRATPPVDLLKGA